MKATSRWMQFPTSRPRRLRQTPAIRAAMQDVSLDAKNFIQPLFVHAGAANQPIDSMPGVERISINNIGAAIAEIEDLQIPSILVFPLPEESEKDPTGKVCTNPKGSIADIVRETCDKANKVNVMVDLCLCPFTDHGHCGIIKNDTIDNDSTLPILGESAAMMASCGVDWVAPSGMMDGMVDAIRTALDKAKYPDISILSYSLKFASGFYGPFRDAAHSAPSFSDRRTYQMDYRSSLQIFQELEQDIEQGADAIMVKPALAYLDIIYRAKEICESLPLAAYQVSGEYSMIKLSGEAGILDEAAVFDETLHAYRRAGADWLISYYATEFLRQQRG